jgi:ABC-2 type transport system permease protein
VKTFFALLRAALTEFRRDRTTFSFTIVLPVLLVAFFAFAFSSSNSRLAVAVILPAHRSDPALMNHLSRLERAGDISVDIGDSARETARLRDGSSDILVDARGSMLVVRYAAHDGASALAARSVAARLEGAKAESAGPVSFEAVSGLANSRLDFVIPGILATAIMWLGIFAAIPLVQQREEQVLRRFSVTPVPRGLIVSAQVVSRLIVSVVQAAFILLAARLILGVPVGSQVGSLGAGLGAIVAIALLGALTFVAIGYAIAAVSSTQSAAHAWAQLATMPMLVLAGVFFPVSAMPGFLMPVSDILPLTYLADALRQTSVDAPHVAPLPIDVLVLAVWSALCLAFAIRYLRWSR